MQRLEYLVLCCTLVAVSSVPTPTEVYPGSKPIRSQDEYHLYWKHDKQTITIEIHSKTTGWVGFGLSPGGGMPNSDMLVGYVKNGQGYFKDLWATARSRPTIDTQQDWELLAATENSGMTMVKCRRKLSTGDTQQDRIIGQGSMSVLWAMGASDPTDFTLLQKHNIRGSTMIDLLDNRYYVATTASSTTTSIPTTTAMPTTSATTKSAALTNSQSSNVTESGGAQVTDKMTPKTSAKPTVANSADSLSSVSRLLTLFYFMYLLINRYL